MTKFFDNNGNEVYRDYTDLSSNIITSPLYNAEILQIAAEPKGKEYFDSNIYLFRMTLGRYEERDYTFNYNVNVGYNLSISIIFSSRNKMHTITYSAKGDIGDTIFTYTYRTHGTNYEEIEIRLIPIYYNNALFYYLMCRKRETNTDWYYNTTYTNNYCAGVKFNTEYNGYYFTNDNNEITSKRDLDGTDTTTGGGGYGTGKMPHDSISIPSLPILEFSDAGSTMYLLSSEEMKSFSSWLWTTDWSETIKKIRTEPMQNIIGVSIIDFPITTGGTTNILVGNVNTGIKGTAIDNNFVAVDCGEITLDEYYGSFADYEPFIATTLYLPKVGFVQIPADVCVNNTIKVVYHIEMSSGEGLCYVQLTSKRDGITYIWNTYTCHVSSNITLSAQDHSQQLVALGNAIINTGISASNAIINPASAGQGLSNTLSSCIDVATTKNPTSTKGNVGNMSAVMCYKKPYLLINRTNLTKPASFQENNGYLINYTAKINEHKGFLKTRDFHAEFNAPYNHKVEIERIMNEGVFING